MNAITDTYDCRIDGCTQDAKSNRGVYAFLCDEHIAQAKKIKNEAVVRLSLEEAISQQISLGLKDPIEIARKLKSFHGAEWLAAELAAHDEEIVSEIARQTLGRQRRASTLPAVLSGERKPKRETMLAPIFIPGEGWKALGDCTPDDLASREQFYLRAAGSMVRWASWCRECIEAMRAEDVARLGQLKAPLPELPEAEAA